MSLLGVVVDEFLDADLDEADLGEDFVGGGGPGEGLGGCVPVGDVVPEWPTPTPGLAVPTWLGIDRGFPLGAHRYP
jgi:hypothetical protein